MTTIIQVDLQVIDVPDAQDSKEYHLQLTWDCIPSQRAELRLPITIQKPPFVSDADYNFKLGCFAFKHGDRIWSDLEYIPNRRIEEDLAMNTDEFTELPFTISHRIPEDVLSKIKENLAIESGAKVTVQLSPRIGNTLWWQRARKSDIKQEIHPFYMKQYREEEYRAEERLVDFGLDPSTLKFDFSEACATFTI